MKAVKSVGIWMDHASAHVMEFTTDIETGVVTSQFTHESKEKSLEKSENVMHNKEQHQQAEYYKKLVDTIKDYDEVLLFGPTNAKVELLNMVRADHNYEKIRIDVKQTDKMTENQQHAFVRDHFSKH